LQIRQDALDALEAYDWPGNVRELINVMERAVLLCRGTVITPSDLPGAVVRAMPGAPAAIAADPPDPGELRVPEDWLTLGLPDFRRRVTEAAETEYLSALLERSRGRIGVAAELAGVDPRSLFDRLRKQGIRKENFR
jgi:DNA-binding NtrC family response regulator